MPPARGPLRKEVPAHNLGPGWVGGYCVRLWVITVSLPPPHMDSLRDYSSASSREVSGGRLLSCEASVEGVGV